jgi:hypothetical protein
MSRWRTHDTFKQVACIKNLLIQITKKFYPKWAAGIVTRLRAGDGEIVLDSISLLQNVQSGSGAQAASNSVGAE